MQAIVRDLWTRIQAYSCICTWRTWRKRSGKRQTRLRMPKTQQRNSCRKSLRQSQWWVNVHHRFCYYHIDIYYHMLIFIIICWYFLESCRVGKKNWEVAVFCFDHAHNSDASMLPKIFIQSCIQSGSTRRWVKVFCSTLVRASDMRCRDRITICEWVAICYAKCQNELKGVLDIKLSWFMMLPYLGCNQDKETAFFQCETFKALTRHCRLAASKRSLKHFTGLRLTFAFTQ